MDTILSTAKAVLDYLGGPSVLWLVLVCLAVTQLLKLALGLSSAYVAGLRRPPPRMTTPLWCLLARFIPYVTGIAAGSHFLATFGANAWLAGMACGMIGSGTFAGAVFALRHYNLNGVADYLTLAKFKAGT